jgi:hypothetical protein
MFGVQKPITASGRRVHRTTFGLRPAQHRAAMGVMSVTRKLALQAVERRAEEHLEARLRTSS